MSMRLGLITVVLHKTNDSFSVDHMIAKYGGRDVARSAYWMVRTVPKAYALPEWAQHAVAKLMLLPTDATGFARLEDIGTINVTLHRYGHTCVVTVIVPDEYADMWSELL